MAQASTTSAAEFWKRRTATESVPDAAVDDISMHFNQYANCLPETLPALDEEVEALDV